MENYNVDIQTTVNCWKAVNKQLEASADKNSSKQTSIFYLLKLLALIKVYRARSKGWAAQNAERGSQPG